MYKLLTILIVTVALVASCSDSASETETKRMASFEVEGMVCEMGCGASLRKGLYTTEAVDEVKVEYEEQRQQNLIHVYYSAGKTNTEDMLKIIQELNEGQFTAKLIDDKEISESVSKEENESSSSSHTADMEGVEASTESFSLPNLTELLNSLIY